jgi:hypothetical protein
MHDGDQAPASQSPGETMNHVEKRKADGPVEHRSWKWIVVVSLSVLWTFVVFLAYYTVHKPFTPSIILAIVDRTADLAILAVLLLLSAALGSRVLRADLKLAGLEDLLFSTGLGLGFLSLGTLGLGLLGLLHRWLFWLLLVLLVAANARRMTTIVRNLRFRGTWGNSSRLALLLGTFLGVTFLLALASTLTPPVEWDALVYHLAGPKTYIEAGRVLWVPDNFHLSFPALTEMLFLGAMLLKGDILARLVHLTYGVLTVAAIYAFSRKHFDGPVPLLAAVLFASIPTAVTIATWAYVDLALAFYAFIAFFAVINWLDRPGDSRWLLVAGILSGMAMSVKYTGLTSLVVASVLVLVTAFRTRTDYRRWLVGLMVMIVVAVALASPWYLKNLAYTGNPVYPYLLGGRGWNQLRNMWLTSIGVRMSPLRLLLLPWDITVLGTQGTEAFDATISPYFLALLPLALFVHKKHRMLLPLAISSLTIYVLWIAAGAATYSTFVLRSRILLPCFAPLSILAAYVVYSLQELDRKAFSLQRFVLMAIAIGLGINLVSQGLAFVGDDPLPFIVGGESREAYLRRHLADGHYDVLSQINSGLPSSAKVVFFWEPRSYYCERQCLPDVVFDRFSQLALTYDSAEEIAQALQREGISHVLVNERWLALRSHEELFTEDQRELFYRLVDHHLSPLYVDDGLYTLYEVQ